MDDLRMFFTLQKIANYHAPPSMVLRRSAIEIFKLPQITVDDVVVPRIPNAVLGYGEAKAPVLLMMFD